MHYEVIMERARMQQRVFASFTLTALAVIAVSCDSRSNSGSSADSSPATTPIYTPPPPPPPLFDLEENGTYFYVAAVSEEDKKKGKAAGEVLGFRYLGTNAKGEHVVVQIFEDGSLGDKAYCADPCKIIKDGRRRVGFNINSIIGAVFHDAMSGNLVPYGKPDKK